MDHVLVVEDEQPLAKNIVRSLERDGFEAKTALSAREARTALESGGVGMLCLDIGLPDCNGLDLLKEIRRHYPKLPTIVITAHDTAENRARAGGLDAFAFLPKPFALSELRQIAHGAVSARASEARSMQPRATAAVTGGAVPCPPTVAGAPEAPQTVMTYSHDGIGLGHMRRNSAIAARLVQTVPNVNVLMLVGCPKGLMFDSPSGVDSVKLPSILKVATNTWRPRTLTIPVEQARNLRASLIQQSIRIMRPQVFLVDHVPGGVWNELLPTLRMLRALPHPPKVVLGLRDILDAPEVVRETWTREGLYDLISEFYDDVLVYGRREIFDTVAEYGLTRAASANVRYCGYLCAEEPCEGRDAIRRCLVGDSRNKLTVVTAGGGADAYPMIAATLDALIELGSSRCPEVVLITGPLMTRDDRARLQAKVGDLPVRVLTAVPNQHSYLNAADLVITMGGYNTLIETIGLGKPAIVIPRTGPSAEQTMRARLFDSLGLVQTIGLEEATPARLAQAIEDALRCHGRPRANLVADGLDRAVDHIAALLDETRRAAAPARGGAGR